MEDAVLPESHILEVLSRLPLKTIIRCKCVCKKWRDLVSHTYFVDLHLSRSRRCLTFHSDPILELVEVEHEVGCNRLTINRVKSVDLHLSAVGAFNRIFQVGSVNGLICLHQEGYATYIFNPVVEEYMILPEPRFLDYVWCLSYGFGVSLAGEYKVIRVCGWTEPEYLEAEVDAVEIDVYTLGTNQWRRLGQTPFNIDYSGELGSSGVFVKSHVYWIADGQIYDFNLDTKKFE
ncbi:putative F-box domain-containing protein [Helianthus annuus]|uniref:F-box domain-containing protein n=1 Tax=Helianthus annuus TaxID=4232 RepID=A0A251V9S6_HELAN|nr:F-box protein At3g07870 [Helianthus annuus]KAF5814506.1 putative F-box domain-containing protein [Helianthus annuus]KAJ0593105.1 putative F-box domain-containing protein [Helianthus annuus]KAJ0600896.1 putative F-box domain-containing protein [Helianthus annuus]KAJ0608115.1 putative F-box domain-containing protein [Helianthus annuus]KAJ0768183.1 putative F-box domain-containing protein [Helianthus annuus]